MSFPDGKFICFYDGNRPAIIDIKMGKESAITKHKEIIISTAQNIGMNNLSTEKMMERLNTPEKLAKMVTLIEQNPPEHEVTL